MTRRNGGGDGPLLLFLLSRRTKDPSTTKELSLSLSLFRKARYAFGEMQLEIGRDDDAPQNAPRLFERDKKAPSSQFLNPKQKKAKIKTLNMRHTSLSLYFSLLFFFFFFLRRKTKKGMIFFTAAKAFLS